MFFKKFPKVYYPFPTQDEKDTFIRVVTDVTKNLRVYKKALNDIVLFDEYDIIDGDTPEIISEKLYGTPYYHWLIMISNDLYDHINDFPLTDYELSEYVTNKYSDAMGFHHFELNGVQAQPYAELNFLTAIKEIFDDSLPMIPLFDDSSSMMPLFDYTKLYQIRNLLLDSNEVFMIASIGYTVDTNFFSTDERINDVSNIMITNESTPFIRITSIDNDTLNAGVQIMSGDFSKEFYYTVYTRNDEKTILTPVVSFVINENSFIIPDIYNIVTNYQYEVEKNETKRRIKVLSPNFIPVVKREFEEIMRSS